MKPNKRTIDFVCEIILSETTDKKDNIRRINITNIFLY